jgi:hypothetical protein
MTKKLNPPVTERVEVRLTKAEHKMLMTLVEASGLPLSTWLRKLIRDLYAQK